MSSNTFLNLLFFFSPDNHDADEEFQKFKARTLVIA